MVKIIPVAPYVPEPKVTRITTKDETLYRPSATCKDLFEKHGQQYVYDRMIDAANKIRTVVRLREGGYTVDTGELLADLFFMNYDRIRDKYDPNRGVPFLEFCIIEFRYAVRRHIADLFTPKKRRLKIDTTSVETWNPDKDLRRSEDDTIAVGMIELTPELAQQAVSLLKELEPNVSTVIWNKARGLPLEKIAQRLGLSRTTVQRMYRAGIDQLQRLLNDRH